MTQTPYQKEYEEGCRENGLCFIEGNPKQEDPFERQYLGRVSGMNICIIGTATGRFHNKMILDTVNNELPPGVYLLEGGVQVMTELDFSKLEARLAAAWGDLDVAQLLDKAFAQTGKVTKITIDSLTSLSDAFLQDELSRVEEKPKTQAQVWSNDWRKNKKRKGSSKSW